MVYQNTLTIKYLFDFINLCNVPQWSGNEKKRIVLHRAFQFELNNTIRLNSKTAEYRDHNHCLEG